MSTADWTDDVSDLPVSFAFKYALSTASGAATYEVAGRSEKTFASSQLPPGAETAAFVVFCACSVSDVFGASVDVTADVTSTIDFSTSSPAQIASDSVDNSLADALDSNDVDGSVQVVNNAAIVMNYVNCTGIVGCEALNRENCSTTAFTCGECLSGFIGTSGDDNSGCVVDNSANRRQLAVEVVSYSQAAVASIECSSNSSCLLGYCDPGGVCKPLAKQCPGTVDQEGAFNGCSNNGECLYLDISMNPFNGTCSTYNPHCFSVCACAAGFGGEDCSLTDVELAVSETTRVKMCSALANISDIQDQSSAWLTSLSSSMAEVYNPFHVSSSAGTLVCLEAMASMALLSQGFVSEDNSQSIAKVLSAFIDAVKLKVVSGAVVDSSKAEVLNAITVSLTTFLDGLFGSVVSPGQGTFDVVSTSLSIRLYYDTRDSFKGANNVLQAPLSAAEQLLDISAPEVMLSPTAGMGSCQTSDGFVQVAVVKIPFSTFNNGLDMITPLVFLYTGSSFIKDAVEPEPRNFSMHLPLIRDFAFTHTTFSEELPTCTQYSGSGFNDCGENAAQTLSFSFNDALISVNDVDDLCSASGRRKLQSSTVGENTNIFGAISGERFKIFLVDIDPVFSTKAVAFLTTVLALLIFMGALLYHQIWKQKQLLKVFAKGDATNKSTAASKVAIINKRKIPTGIVQDIEVLSPTQKQQLLRSSAPVVNPAEFSKMSVDLNDIDFQDSGEDPEASNGVGFKSSMKINLYDDSSDDDADSAVYSPTQAVDLGVSLYDDFSDDEADRNVLGTRPLGLRSFVDESSMNDDWNLPSSAPASPHSQLSYRRRAAKVNPLSTASLGESALDFDFLASKHSLRASHMGSQLRELGFQCTMDSLHRSEGRREPPLVALSLFLENLVGAPLGSKLIFSPALSFVDRCWDSMQQYHPYLALATWLATPLCPSQGGMSDKAFAQSQHLTWMEHTNTYLRTCVRCLGTLYAVMLFYDLNFPLYSEYCKERIFPLDDPLVLEARCKAPSAVFDSSVSYCEWFPAENACMQRAPPNSIVSFVIVAFLVEVCFVMVDTLFLSYLVKLVCAPQVHYWPFNTWQGFRKRRKDDLDIGLVKQRMRAVRTDTSSVDVAGGRDEKGKLRTSDLFAPTSRDIPVTQSNLTAILSSLSDEETKFDDFAKKASFGLSKNSSVGQLGDSDIRLTLMSPDPKDIYADSLDAEDTVSYLFNEIQRYLSAHHGIASSKSLTFHETPVEMTSIVEREAVVHSDNLFYLGSVLKPLRLQWDGRAISLGMISRLLAAAWGWCGGSVNGFNSSVHRYNLLGRIERSRSIARETTEHLNVCQLHLADAHTNKLNVENMADIIILRQFILDMFIDAPMEQTAVSSLMKPLSSYYSVEKPVSVVRWAFAVVVVAGGCLFMIQQMYHWATLNNDLAVYHWMATFALIVLFDVVVYRGSEIYVRYVFTIERVRLPLKAIFNVLLKLVTEKITETPNREEPSSTMDANATTSDPFAGTCIRVLQHLLPSCIVARNSGFVAFMSSQLLLQLDDSDMRQCSEQSSPTNVDGFVHQLLSGMCNALPSITLAFSSQVFLLWGETAHTLLLRLVIACVWTGTIVAALAVYKRSPSIFLIAVWFILGCAACYLFYGWSSFFASDHDKMVEESAAAFSASFDKSPVGVWRRMNARASSRFAAVGDDDSSAPVFPEEVLAARSIARWHQERDSRGDPNIEPVTGAPTVLPYHRFLVWCFGGDSLGEQYVGGDYTDMLASYLEATGQARRLESGAEDQVVLDLARTFFCALWTPMRVQTVAEALELCSQKFAEMSSQPFNRAPPQLLSLPDLLVLSNFMWRRFYPAGEPLTREEWVQMCRTLEEYVELRVDDSLNFADYAIWFSNICKEIAEKRSKAAADRLFLAMDTEASPSSPFTRGLKPGSVVPVFPSQIQPIPITLDASLLRDTAVQEVAASILTTRLRDVEPEPVPTIDDDEGLRLRIQKKFMELDNTRRGYLAINDLLLLTTEVCQWYCPPGGIEGTVATPLTEQEKRFILAQLTKKLKTGRLGRLNYALYMQWLCSCITKDIGQKRLIVHRDVSKYTSEKSVLSPRGASLGKGPRSSGVNPAPIQLTEQTITEMQRRIDAIPRREPDTPVVRTVQAQFSVPFMSPSLSPLTVPGPTGSPNVPPRPTVCKAEDNTEPKPWRVQMQGPSAFSSPGLNSAVPKAKTIQNESNNSMTATPVSRKVSTHATGNLPSDADTRAEALKNAAAAIRNISKMRSVSAARGGGVSAGDTPGTAQASTSQRAIGLMSVEDLQQSTDSGNLAARRAHSAGRNNSRPACELKK